VAQAAIRKAKQRSTRSRTEKNEASWFTR
jgi:hypothetical protein